MTAITHSTGSPTRKIEHRIAQNLLKRRAADSQRRSAAQFIKGVAVFTVALLLAASAPQLLVPLFVGALLIVLGV